MPDVQGSHGTLAGQRFSDGECIKPSSVTAQATSFAATEQVMLFPAVSEAYPVESVDHLAPVPNVSGFELVPIPAN